MTRSFQKIETGLQNELQSSEKSYSKPDFKVGYANPPKHSQFKKGHSGNPRGRKRRSENTNVLLLEDLAELIEVREKNGTTRRITRRHAVIRALVNDAILGRPHARQLLIKVLDIQPSPEAFTPTKDDEELLQRFLEDGQKKSDEPSDQE
ncbi:DUF5681 domain-containing protein [Tianweitania sediminis]|uniref:DUF5681 domain-containing protein n=1 Tax=Tianweitania sediminis TaxID=1502156 RepID=A0A8J7UKP2_9HYPH|nr:DUF5681 domain-containing protein [Tianweitania sediminis]MBP0441378.1 hypothetical protein [Tianweitania sediminis]